MGLDISYYKELKKVEKQSALDEDEELKDDIIQIYNSDGLQDRSIPFKQGEYYLAENREAFCFGSYSSYNRWRNKLAKLAGFASASCVWDYDLKGDFTELINFSDCEGIIGSVISKKLYNDFVKYKDKAEEIGDNDLFLRKYNQMKEAFRVASEKNGCVEFH